MGNDIKYKDLEQTRLLAYTIVDNIFYPDGTKSHAEYAKRINQAGDIARMIDKHNNKSK